MRYFFSNTRYPPINNIINKFTLDRCFLLPFHLQTFLSNDLSFQHHVISQMFILYLTCIFICILQFSSYIIQQKCFLCFQRCYSFFNIKFINIHRYYFYSTSSIVESFSIQYVYNRFLFLIVFWYYFSSIRNSIRTINDTL